MSDGVSMYGEGAITGNVDDAALAAKAEANGVSLTDGETSINLTPKEPEDKPQQTTESTPPSGLDKQLADNKTTEEALKKDLTEKGVDFSTAVSEYNEKGSLSSETLEALNKAGYPKEVIEGYIQSRQVLESQYTNAVYEAAGGEAEYTKMTQWASSNLSKSDIEAFNSAIDSGNLGTVKLIMGGIRSAMGVSQTSKYGTNKPSIMGGTTTAPSNDGFANKSEMVKAMSDKRYARDPQYTREVESKMSKTTWF